VVKDKKEFVLTSGEKKICVELASKSIKYSLMNDGLFSLRPDEVAALSENLKRKKACFVTLTNKGELRGCMGHLISFQPLYKDIIQNAYTAAFSDTRFSQLSAREFSEINIEVSILTDPKELDFIDSKDLLSKITPKKDGIIITKGFNTATFLPSVWADLPKKEAFLSQLCLKAGLLQDDWKKSGLKVQVYSAI
jgi:uncharacterized protein